MIGTGYQLSRRYFDWCFKNPGSHSPAHGALYAWFMEACNRVEWADVFEMAPQYAMTAVGIRAYNTYKDTLADLQAWGFVRICQKGANQYTPWLLALSNFDEPLNNPLDKANGSAVSNFDIPLNKARDKARNKAVDEARDANTINNKPENSKPETPNKSAVADAPVSGEGVKPSGQKKGKDPPVPANPPKLVTRIKELIESRVEGYYWQAKDGAAARDIGNKLRNAIKHKNEADGRLDECTDDDIINALTVLLDRCTELPVYFQFTDLPALNGKFNEIITQLKVPRTKPAGTKPIAPGHATAEQRLSKVAALFDRADKRAGRSSTG